MPRDRTALAIKGAEIAERLYWLALHNGAVGDTAAVQRALSEELRDINRKLTENRSFP